MHEIVKNATIHEEKESPMTSRIIIALVLLIALTGCGDTSSVVDLDKKNAELTARVKALEEQTLAIDKKLIQHQQAMATLNQRVRDMEGEVDRARMGR